MTTTPQSVAAFLEGRRLIVTGVSRKGTLPANHIFRRLRQNGHEVFPVNPNATQVEGVLCYPDIRSVPGVIDGIIIASPPQQAADCVRQSVARGIRKIWFHRAFGNGSVSDEALTACIEHGLEPIVGGCPMMYSPPVDVFHRCMKWLLHMQNKIPR